MFPSNDFLRGARRCREDASHAGASVELVRNVISPRSFRPLLLDAIVVACTLACFTLIAFRSSDSALVIKAMFLAIAGLLIGYIGEKAKARSRASDAGPASTSRLRRVRARARSEERARIARELHDGIVQTLSAAELRMDVIRRQVAAAAPQQADALLAIQESVKHEVRDLRLLTRRMQEEPVPVPSTITEALSQVIERFRQETGMSIAFVCDDAEVPLRRAARHEIERIVQEALTNIRKHSGAHCVTVSAGLRRGRWMVSIEDDGHGFPFAGPWTHWQLDQAQQGPFVIKQRARAMDATLSVSSTPGRGARLELEVPLLP